MGNNDQPILVLGGTGHYGRHIVGALLARNLPVRVLTRNAAQAAALLGDRPVFVEGDITHRPDVARALEGASALIISISAMTPGQIRRMKAIEQDAVIAALDEAQDAGVNRVVFISVYDLRDEVGRRFRLPSANIKKAVEDQLARSSLNWTVLGAPPSMEIFFAMIRGGIMTVPGGGPPALPVTSPRDLGEIAAQAVLRSDLSGMRIRLPGPEALSFPQAAKIIGAAWGRAIGFRKIPLILPRIAWWITRPLALVGDRALFVHTMLGFIRLLNGFPADIAEQAGADHERLRALFDYTPTTLAMEAQHKQRKQ